MNELLLFMLQMMMLGILCNLPLLGIIIWKKFLSVSGMIAGGIVSLLLFCINPLLWVALVVFFVSSSLISKIKARQKETFDFQKSSTRDAMQVFANSILPLSFGIIDFFTKTIITMTENEIFFFDLSIYSSFSPFFIGAFISLAVHNADTWATELGVLSKEQPISIVTFKKVIPGTSGGVTKIGTTASLVGSALIAITFIILNILVDNPVDNAYRNKLLVYTLIITLAGLIGSLIDSIEGATIQGIYFCEICSKETESNPHRCGNETVLIKGSKWFSNDFVNLSSSLLASLLGLTISVFVFTFIK